MDIQIVETLNRFEELAAELAQRNQRALKKGVDTCVKVADPLTRVDTGMLKANKTIELSAESATITWNQNYAAYQNFGTYKMSGTNFAGAGMDAALPVIEDELNGFGGR